MSDSACRFLSVALVAALTASGGRCQVQQELQLVRAVAAEAIALKASTLAERAVPAGLPANAEVTSGLWLDSSAFCADASVQLAHDVQNHVATARLIGSLGAIPAIAPGATASIGRVALRLEWKAPRPMRLRFGLSIDVAASPLTSPMHGEIDLFADGHPDLQFTTAPGTCGSDAASQILEVPAGTFEVGLVLTGDLPAVDAPTCLGQWGTVQVTIQPAHVEIDYEGLPCGGSINTESLLDGESVRFYVGPQAWGGAALLVLGVAPTSLPIVPFAPCSLLVTPEVVLTVPYLTALDLPLARLGRGRLYAQGLLLQPPSWFSPTAQVKSSNRLVLSIQ